METGRIKIPVLTFFNGINLKAFSQKIQIAFQIAEFITKTFC
jgi:hypothetical protein